MNAVEMACLYGMRGLYLSLTNFRSRSSSFFILAAKGPLCTFLLKFCKYQIVPTKSKLQKQQESMYLYLFDVWIGQYVSNSQQKVRPSPHRMCCTRVQASLYRSYIYLEFLQMSYSNIQANFFSKRNVHHSKHEIIQCSKRCE
jgi:hypothetical protein